MDLLGDLQGLYVAEFGNLADQFLVEAANRGARVYGAQLNPLVSIVTNRQLKGRGRSEMNTFLSCDLSEFDVVILTKDITLVYFAKRIPSKLQEDNFRGRLLTFSSPPLPGMTPAYDDGLIAIYDLTQGQPAVTNKI